MMNRIRKLLLYSISIALIVIFGINCHSDLDYQLRLTDDYSGILALFQRREYSKAYKANIECIKKYEKYIPREIGILYLKKSDIEFYYLHDNNSALKSITKAIDLENTQQAGLKSSLIIPYFHLLRIEILMKLGRTDQAKEEFQEWKSYSVCNPQGYASLPEYDMKIALLYLQFGEPKKSLEQITRALSCSLGYKLSIYNAYVLYRMNQPKKSLGIDFIKLTSEIDSLTFDDQRIEYYFKQGYKNQIRMIRLLDFIALKKLDKARSEYNVILLENSVKSISEIIIHEWIDIFTSDDYSIMHKFEDEIS